MEPEYIFIAVEDPGSVGPPEVIYATREDMERMEDEARRYGYVYVPDPLHKESLYRRVPAATWHIATVVSSGRHRETQAAGNVNDR